MATFRFSIAARVCASRSSPPTSAKSGASATWPAKWTTFVPDAIATWLKPGAGCSPAGFRSSRWCIYLASLADETPELGVGDQPALPRARPFDLLEQCREALLGHVEPELADLDTDRVQPALLAEHDPALGPDELRRVRLDRGRVVELRGDGAGLPDEEVLAGDRLPGRQRRAGELLHEAGERAGLLDAKARRDAVERLEREGDLDEVGVAGALPHPVHRPLDPGRAGLHRCDRGRRGEPEVVMPVPVDRDLVVEALGDVADQERRRLRGGDAERVHDDHLGGTCVDRRLVGSAQEPEVGPRRVDAEERDPDPVLDGEGNGRVNPLEHRLACDPERGELPVRDRALDHGGGDPELDE